MRRRWLILLALLVLTIWGAGEWVVRSERFTSWLTTRSEAYLADRLRQEVKIGKVQVGFIPLRLEVFGLDVGPPDAPLLLLSSGSVSLNPLPLLFHRLTLSRITLERPRVDLIQTEGGWNLPRFSGGGGGWSVVVGKIVLRGGAIRVRIPPSGRSVSLERIDLTLAPDLTKRRWKAVLNAGAGEWTEPNFTQKIDRLSFDGSVA